MASVNKVILVGNLGRDPETRSFPDGGSICNVTIATSRQWKDKTSGERQEETEWHRVVFRDRLAEIAGEYLKKGRSVYVEGRLKTRKWQDKDGVEKYTTEIVATDMQLLGSREGMGGADAEGGAPRERSSQRPAGNAEAGRTKVVDRLRRHGRRHPVLKRSASRSSGLAEPARPRHPRGGQGTPGAALRFLERRRGARRWRVPDAVIGCVHCITTGCESTRVRGGPATTLRHGLACIVLDPAVAADARRLRRRAATMPPSRHRCNRAARRRPRRRPPAACRASSTSRCNA